MAKIDSVSVIIPTFNRKAVIDRAVRSVVSQTVSPTEIIVVDDGSTDGSAAYLRRNYSDIEVVEQENFGVSSARNHGVRVSSGRWLAFLDSDDAWLPRKLERQLAALERSEEYRICHTDEIWIRHGRRVNPKLKHRKSGGWIFSKCLPLCVISPSSVLLDRSLLEDLGTFDEELPACEDYDLWLRICSRYPVLFVDEPLVVKYGGHADQLSRTIWGLDRFRIQALAKLLDEGVLSADQRSEARMELLRKIDIVAAGAEKRERAQELARLGELRTRYEPSGGRIEEVLS